MDNLRRLMVAIKQIDGNYYKWVKHAKSKENELALLYALSDGKEYSQIEICREWNIPKTTINTIVKEFEAKEYIVFNKLPHSKEKKISLTEKGKIYANGCLLGLNLAQRQAYEETIEKFSDDFVEVIEYFASALNEKFEKI